MLSLALAIGLVCPDPLIIKEGQLVKLSELNQLQQQQVKKSYKVCEERYPRSPCIGRFTVDKTGLSFTVLCTQKVKDIF